VLPRLPEGALRGRFAMRSSAPKRAQPYLVRVIVETTDEMDVVVTVHRTSKLEKYWADT